MSVQWTHPERPLLASGVTLNRHPEQPHLWVLRSPNGTRLLDVSEFSFPMYGFDLPESEGT